MSDTSALTIGRVTDLLKEEFPGLTMSKVRFLETRGLIHPTRSSSGYRQFLPGDISRLRFILRQQRDHFLPLKVIKSQLARWEQGGEADPERAEAGDTSSSPEPSVEVLDLGEFARRASVSRSEIRQLVSHGLFAPAEGDGVPRFDNRDVAVARLCGVLLEQGLEARHLRIIRNAVLRHVQLLEGLTLAMRRNRSPEARRQAVENLTTGAEAMRRLIDLLFLAEVRAILDED